MERQNSLESVLGQVDKVSLADQNSQQWSDSLVQKSLALMGLSKQLESTWQGAQLQGDALKLLRLAERVKDDQQTQAVRKEAEQIIRGLNEKYKLDQEAGSLMTEAQALWSDLTKTEDAQQLVASGMEILQQWQQYGGSEEGQQHLGSLTQVLDQHGAEWLSSVSQLAQDPESSLGKENVEYWKKFVTHASEMLQEDEDVQQLLKKGQQAASTHQEAPAALLQAATQHTTAVLADLRKTGAGQQLLQAGSAWLEGNKELLTPEALLAKSKQLGDADGRQQLANQIKDAAVEWLLSYLPTIQVGVVAGEVEGLQYQLDNVDLSHFKLDPSLVTVTLHDNGIEIQAKGMSCLMNQLKWSYKQIRFPYAYGEGEADSEVRDVVFSAMLVIQGLEHILPSTASPLVAAGAQNSKNVNQAPQEPDRVEEWDPFRVSTFPTAASQLRSLGAAAGTSPTASSSLGGDLLGGEAAGQVSGAHPPCQSDLSQLNGQQSDSAWDPFSVGGPGPLSCSDPLRSSTAADAPSATGVAPTIHGHSISLPALPALHPDRAAAPTASAPDLATLDVVPSSGDVSTSDAQLVIERMDLVIGEVTMLIKKSWLAGVYNLLIRMFSSEVKQYLQKYLNQMIAKHGGELLTTINGYAKQYLPLFKKWQVKGGRILAQADAAARPAIMSEAPL